MRIDRLLTLQPAQPAQKPAAGTAGGVRNRIARKV
jgi:hypothetical protein